VIFNFFMCERPRSSPCAPMMLVGAGMCYNVTSLV
jgi:hypothetical protein